MDVQNKYWPEYNPPAYRRGHEDNHLAIIMQNPASKSGSFADCGSGRDVRKLLRVLHDHDQMRFKDFDWECVHLINAWPSVDLPKGNWEKQLDAIRLSVQKHEKEFLSMIEGKNLILFGKFAEAAYMVVRKNFIGNKIIKLYHPSGIRSRNIKVFKNYLNSRKVFSSLSNFQVLHDIAVRENLLAQLYADYIYLRWEWCDKYKYSFTFERFLNKLYGEDDQ